MRETYVLDDDLVDFILVLIYVCFSTCIIIPIPNSRSNYLLTSLLRLSSTNSTPIGPEDQFVQLLSGLLPTTILLSMMNPAVLITVRTTCVSLRPPAPSTPLAHHHHSTSTTQRRKCRLYCHRSHPPTWYRIIRLPWILLLTKRCLPMSRAVHHLLSVGSANLQRIKMTMASKLHYHLKSGRTCLRVS